MSGMGDFIHYLPPEELESMKMMFDASRKAGFLKMRFVFFLGSIHSGMLVTFRNYFFHLCI